MRNFLQIKSVLLILPLLFNLAYADDAPAIQWGGSARTRVEYDYFNNFQNIRQMGWMRFRPYFSAEPEAGLNVYFEPQFAKAMGESVVSSNSTTGTTEQTSGLTSDPSLSIHQAYMNYSSTPLFQARVGRQILGYGDELVIGALEWNNVGRSFDGIRLRHETEGKKLDLFWTKLVDTNVNASGTGDYDFFGSYNNFKKAFGIDEADLYALYLLDTRGIGPDPLQLYTFGLRLKSKIDAFDYRIETTQQLGQIAGSTLGAHGTQGDIELGYRLGSELGFRVGVEGFYADKEYNQLFPTAHKWLGILDAFGRKNIRGFKIHTTTQLTERSKLMIDGHRFYRATRSELAYRANGSAIARSNVGDSYLGTEFDVTGQYDLSAHTSIQVGVSALFTGATLSSVDSRNPLFGYASWEIKL